MAKGDYLSKCDVCGKPADGPMLAPMFAHADCVIQELNKLIDPDYEGNKEPVRFIGKLAQAHADERAKTLREVGEFIEKRSYLGRKISVGDKVYHTLWLKPSELQALKTGKMPEADVDALVIAVRADERAKTLREVGEWLRLKMSSNYEVVRVRGMTDVRILHPLDFKVLVEALKTGKMPEAK